MAALEARIKPLVRPMRGFPTADFVFGDVTPLLADAAAFGLCIDALVARYQHTGLVAVAAPEARGFLFGPAVAKALGVAFLPIRKAGQLPASVHESDAVAMDYGERRLELHQGLLPSAGAGAVVVVDDILATGGSAFACAQLLQRLGMMVVEIAVVYDYSGGASSLPGRSVLAEHGYAVFALARFCRDGDMRWWLERGRESDVLHSPHAGKAHTKH